jgi:nicotinamidase-related amidase
MPSPNENSARNENSALLVMDVQHGILERLGADRDGYLARVRATVEAARGNGVPVRFVVVGFRPGMPEASPRNRAFGAYKQQAATFLGDPRPAITPEGTDLVITKKRVSAFTGSDLEVVLRSGDVQHLVLCGIATGGVVLSTLREAADKDYRLTVLSDLCFDPDPEIHRVLLEKVFVRQAEVTDSAAWVRSLG